MRILRLALTVIFLTSVVVPCHSDGPFYDIFRKLEQESDDLKLNAQVSPSPSPVPVENRNSGKAGSPVNSPKTETCDMVVDKCGIVESHVLACVPFDGNGCPLVVDHKNLGEPTEERNRQILLVVCFKHLFRKAQVIQHVSQANYVLVINEGESSHSVNITIFPANVIVEENTNIPGHQSKKVKLLSNMGSGYSSILLSVEKGNCTIHLGASLPKGFYMNYVTPVNGTYLFFVTAFFIGGTLICCKFKRKGRHLDGVKYKELEMGEQQPNSTFTIETREDWDEEWGDDDWDVEKR